MINTTTELPSCHGGDRNGNCLSCDHQVTCVAAAQPIGKPEPSEPAHVLAPSSGFRKDPALILDEMADTFRERNKVYGDNYKMVGQMMKVLFPNGLPPDLVYMPHFHLFELKLVKLSRFAISNLTHIDSIHDDAVYSAMIESIITNEEHKQ